MKIKIISKCIREYKKTSVLTPLFVTFEVILECLIPFIMAKLVDDMSADNLTPIIKYGAVLISLALLSLLCGFLSGKFAATASSGFAKNLRHDLYYKIQDFSFSEIDKFSSSSLVTRLTTDVTNVQNAYQMIIRVAVRTPLMVIFSFIMSFSVSARMSLIFVGVLPFLAAILFGIIFITMPIFKRIFKKYDALNNSVQENISGIRVVKSYVRESYENEKFAAASEAVRVDFTKVEKILALNNPTMMVCIYTAMVLLSILGARLIITSHGSELTTGELSSLISYGIQILMSMMMLSMVFVMTTMASESAERISEVLQTEPSLKNAPNAVTEVPDGSVKFHNVSFRYSSRAKKDALENINLTIPSGSTLGILGGTGSSKSSLVQLIPRLYDATRGEVYVGGTDVKKYDLHSLRDEVAVVLQKNVLFAGTIKENLRWGNSHADDAELERVCKLAQADEFIEALPDKYDTFIEQGGTNISGGQKQRLCIARALLKKPKILILDDSTSAVDTKTDAMLRRAMREELPDTTKIIIAQRVASVEDADNILVLEGGREAEYGSPDYLMHSESIYKEIYEAQLKGKED